MKNGACLQKTLMCDVDKSGEIEKVEFQVLLREIFDTFAVQLKSTPIFMSSK